MTARPNSKGREAGDGDLYNTSPLNISPENPVIVSHHQCPYLENGSKHYFKKKHTKLVAAQNDKER